MQNFIKKENDYHGYICYSKIFLLFHIDKNIILKIMEQKKPKENEELVLFELEQPNKFDKENATNTDISEFSLNPKNKKILFFPYSCFEISEISKNEKKYYTIRLEYLGKYVDKLPKRFEDINDIPESQFTQDFLSSQIYSQKGIERLIAKKPNFLPFSFKKYITDKNKEVNRKSNVKNKIFKYRFKNNLDRKKYLKIIGSKIKYKMMNRCKKNLQNRFIKIKLGKY